MRSMTRGMMVGAFLGSCLASNASHAQFTPYPGARATDAWLVKYRDTANEAVKQSNPAAYFEMWITSDSFEEVRAFYAKQGVERQGFAAPLKDMLKVQTGRDAAATYVIFDGASGPVESHHYVAIQRPVPVTFTPLELRDVTLISLYREKK